MRSARRLSWIVRRRCGFHDRHDWPPPLRSFGQEARHRGGGDTESIVNLGRLRRRLTGIASRCTSSTVGEFTPAVRPDLLRRHAMKLRCPGSTVLPKHPAAWHRGKAHWDDCATSTRGGFGRALGAGVMPIRYAADRVHHDTRRNPKDHTTSLVRQPLADTECCRDQQNSASAITGRYVATVCTPSNSSRLSAGRRLVTQPTGYAVGFQYASPTR